MRWYRSGGQEGPDLAGAIAGAEDPAATVAAAVVGAARTADVDPYEVAAAVLAAEGNPALGVARIVDLLLSSGAVQEEEIAAAGIDAETVGRMRDLFTGGRTYLEADAELRVRAAERALRQDVRTILDAETADPSERKARRLARVLAEKALDDGLTDLRLAHRLLRAEEPDRLSFLAEPDLAASRAGDDVLDAEVEVLTAGGKVKVRVREAVEALADRRQATGGDQG